MDGFIDSVTDLRLARRQDDAIQSNVAFARFRQVLEDQSHFRVARFAFSDVSERPRPRLTSRHRIHATTLTAQGA